MNLNLFWASYLTMKREEEEQVQRDKAIANVGKLVTAVEAPFASGTTISQFFIVQLLGRFFSWFSSR